LILVEKVLAQRLPLDPGGESSSPTAAPCQADSRRAG
jgi:hypothetical protein